MTVEFLWRRAPSAVALWGCAMSLIFLIDIPSLPWFSYREEMGIFLLPSNRVLLSKGRYHPRAPPLVSSKASSPKQRKTRIAKHFAVTPTSKARLGESKESATPAPHLNFLTHEYVAHSSTAMPFLWCIRNLRRLAQNSDRHALEHCTRSSQRTNLIHSK